MQVLSARNAVDLVKTGDTIAISGIASIIAPEAVLKALGECFRDTGSPKNLTVICPCRTGWSEGGDSGAHGLEHLAQPGLVRRLIASSYSYNDTPELLKLAVNNEIETYIAPMGVLFRWLRECAAKSPGMLTDVGIGTFFDPASENAGDIRASSKANPLDLVKRVQVDGTDCIFFRSIPIDVAVVRGTISDTDGNISLAGEPISAGVRHMAMAAKTCGGKVIAVVKALTERGTLHPRMVEIPGIFVDVVVVDPNEIQTQLDYEPAFTGEIRTPTPPISPLALNSQKVILRRGALELEKGDVINLGFGMPTYLPSLALEEGFFNDVTFSLEHGSIGGIPAMGVPGRVGAFGANFNPQSIIDSTDIFTFYHGGGLTATFLGFAEVDEPGNVNVSRYSGLVRGPGGYIDIVHRTKKIMICGTLTSGSLEVRIETDGRGSPKVSIVREGRQKKFPQRVEQIDLYGPGAVDRGQKVLVITERCVFEVRAKGLTLIEVAPGIDVDKHIKPMLNFELLVDDRVRTMPQEIFRPGRMNLRLKDRGSS
jgi:acyl CoA:acetate/3-ketoacid CoA transferase